MRSIGLAIVLASGGCAAVPAEGRRAHPAQGPSRETITFHVERRRATHCDSPDSRTSEEARIEYRVRVAERRSPRDLTLLVTFGSFAVKYADDHESWVLDSAGPEEEDGGDPACAYARNLLRSAVTVMVRDGRVADMRGFPPREWGVRGSVADWAYYQRTKLLAEAAVARDLSLIIATDMRSPGARPPIKPQGRAGSRARGWTDDGIAEAGMVPGEIPLSFVWLIDEDFKGEPASRYSIGGGSPDPYDSEPRSISVEGEAFVSKEDGFLLRLEMRSSERNVGGGRTLDLSGQTAVTRAGPEGERPRRV